MKELKIKRVYEAPSLDDGVRILVDRLWPRGIKKEDARIDFWDKEIAPSTELREWFGHKPELFEEFSKKYMQELKNHEDRLKEIKEMLKTKNVTLVYGAKDTKDNQAVVLKKVIDKI